MGRARHPHLAATACALVLALALATVGCGSGSADGGSTNGAGSPGAGTTTEAAPAGVATYTCRVPSRRIGDLRSSGVLCHRAAAVATAWATKDGCALSAGASRGGCTAAGFRCLATSTDRGLAVSCARPGHSLSFVARR